MGTDPGTEMLAGQQAAAYEMRRQLGNELRTQVGALHTEMRSSFRKIQKVLGGVQARLGNLYEAQKRSAIAQLFGEKYSQQLTAVSVQDFVLLLPDRAVLSPPQTSGSHSKQRANLDHQTSR